MSVPAVPRRPPRARKMPTGTGFRLAAAAAGCRRFARVITYARARSGFIPPPGPFAGCAIPPGTRRSRTFGWGRERWTKMNSPWVAWAAVFDDGTRVGRSHEEFGSCHNTTVNLIIALGLCVASSNYETISKKPTAKWAGVFSQLERVPRALDKQSVFSDMPVSRAKSPAWHC